MKDFEVVTPSPPAELHPRTSHPTLRFASLEDIPAIMALGNDLFQDSSLSMHQINPKKVRSNLEAAIVNQQNWLVLLSHEQGRVVGCLVAHCFEPLYADDKVACEVLWHLLPEFRKGARGLDMMKAFEYWAKNMGAKHCQYGWLASSPARMETLYEKRGMVLVEKVYYKEL